MSGGEEDERGQRHYQEKDEGASPGLVCLFVQHPSAQEGVHKTAYNHQSRNIEQETGVQLGKASLNGPPDRGHEQCTEECAQQQCE